MDIGWLDICLKVKDITQSRPFYESIGFERVEGKDEEGWAVMVKEESRIGLYQEEHMGKDTFSLNFRGADINKINTLLTQNSLTPEPQSKPNPDGSGSIWLKDPDGHTLFFDTMKGETKQTP